MILRIKRNEDSRIIKIYLLAMFALMVARYLFAVQVPAAAFLLVTMLPIWFGDTSAHLAFMMSCIPFSVAFQYKYALLILAFAILVKKSWRLKKSYVLFLVLFMMLWELLHAFYGKFSLVEYLRGFAELILLALITSIDVKDLDYKLIVRSLAVSVVGVCVIMLFMQLQQFNFNLIEVFARSAQSFRFGQSNMDDGDYALNFNANNLGFICNLSICGCLLLVSRKKNTKWDWVLIASLIMFVLMTLSRSGFICAIVVFLTFFFFNEGKSVEKITRGIGGFVVALIVLQLMWNYLPSVFDNIFERFQRADVWNGRGSLFLYYSQFILSSWPSFFLGIGVQQIFEKVAPYFPVHAVPHNGFQEVWLAWGVIGVVLMLTVVWQIATKSKWYAGGKRKVYQFMPLGLTLFYTMSGQLLTSSRALLALSFSYICLCMPKTMIQTKE